MWSLIVYHLAFQFLQYWKHLHLNCMGFIKHVLMKGPDNNASILKHTSFASSLQSFLIQYSSSSLHNPWFYETHSKLCVTYPEILLAQQV